MMESTAQLVALLDGARVEGVLPAAVGGLATDSRDVRPGSLFVALRGAHVDGHDFIAAAVDAGAVGVVCEREPPIPIPHVLVPDTHGAISRLAAGFFGHPSRALRVVGVTGTNGKTTTVSLIAAVLGAAGSPCATIGTLGAAFGDRRWPLGNTTPPALELHALLAELRAAGAASVAMEVSSHALALGRADDVRFAAAALTNVTRDHLDFHQTFEAYVAAKRRLFDLAPLAALNVDDPAGAAFARELPAAITFAIDAPARVRACDLAPEPAGTRFRVDGTRVALPLRGRFNVSNALAAFAVARALGLEDAGIARALSAAAPVPGRMERIASGGIEAIVDYAHTPDALANVLTAARESTSGRLIVVFGCGGDRDPGKRGPMGEIAARLADSVIVTSDNPRSEDPLAIARAVAGATGAEIVLDRRAAIRAGLAAAAPGDTVVVAGKGHETYQIAGAVRTHFDDGEEVRAAFAAREPARALG